MEEAHKNAELHPLLTDDSGANRRLAQNHCKVVMGLALEPRPEFWAHLLGH